MFNYQNESSYRIATKDCQLHDREKIMTELSIADNIMTFYKTVDGEEKALFTDTAVNQFLMLCNLLNNNPELHNLFQLVLIDIKNYREAPCKDDRMTFRIIEYIQMKPLYKPLTFK